MDAHADQKRIGKYLAQVLKNALVISSEFLAYSALCCRSKICVAFYPQFKLLLLYIIVFMDPVVKLPVQDLPRLNVSFAHVHVKLTQRVHLLHVYILQRV